MKDSYNIFTTTNNTDYNNLSHNTQDFYDIQAEEESLLVIKSQNKKLKELYKELNTKEMLMNKVNEELGFYVRNYNELQESRKLFLENEKNLKEQINLLHKQINKFEISDKQKDQINNQNIEKFKLREEDLLNEIALKEEEINCKDEKIKIYEENSQNYAKQIMDLENNIKNKDLEIRELRKKSNEINEQISYYNKEASDLTLKYKLNENEFLSEKENYEIKIQKLVDVIQKQAIELQDLSDNLEQSNNINEKIKSENSKYKKDIDSLLLKIDDLHLNVERLKNIQDSLYEQEKINKDLRDFLGKERISNEYLNEELNKSKREILSLKELVEFKEKVNDEFHIKNTTFENLNYELKNRNMKLEKEIEERLLEENSFNDDLKLFNEIIYRDINISLRYAETYLGNIYYGKNKTKSLSDVGTNLNSYNKSMFKNVIFYDYLKNLDLKNIFDVFSNIQDKIYKEFSQLEDSYSNINKDNLDLNEKIKKLYTDITIKKEEIENLENKLYYLNETNNNLKDQIEEVKQSCKESIQENNNLKKNSINCIKQIENDIIFTLNNIEESNKIRLKSINFSINENNELDENLFSNFIDISELKDIFKISDYNLKNEQFNFEKYRQNINSFFSIFKSISEEYLKSIKKINELSNIKKEVESIKNEFNKEKLKLHKENEDVYKKYQLVKIELENHKNDNNNKINQNHFELEKSMKEELQKKNQIIDNEKNEILFLKSQIEAQDKRIKNLTDGKNELERKYISSIENKDKELRNSIKLINEMKLSIQEKDISICHLKEENEKIIRHIKVLKNTVSLKIED